MTGRARSHSAWSRHWNSTAVAANVRRARLLGPHPRVRNGLAVAPLLDRGGADAIAAGQGSHALLTLLDGAPYCLCRGGAAVENLAHSSSLCPGGIVPPHSGTKHLAPFRPTLLFGLWRTALTKMPPPTREAGRMRSILFSEHKGE